MQVCIFVSLTYLLFINPLLYLAFSFVCAIAYSVRGFSHKMMGWAGAARRNNNNFFKNQV